MQRFGAPRKRDKVFEKKKISVKKKNSFFFNEEKGNEAEVRRRKLGASDPRLSRLSGVGEAFYEGRKGRVVGDKGSKMENHVDIQLVRATSHKTSGVTMISLSFSFNWRFLFIFMPLLININK